MGVILCKCRDAIVWLRGSWWEVACLSGIQRRFIPDDGPGIVGRVGEFLREYPLPASIVLTGRTDPATAPTAPMQGRLVRSLVRGSRLGGHARASRATGLAILTLAPAHQLIDQPGIGKFHRPSYAASSLVAVWARCRTSATLSRRCRISANRSSGMGWPAGRGSALRVRAGGVRLPWLVITSILQQCRIMLKETSEGDPNLV